MTAFFTALFFILIAEMGDKTQLLAMAFACRYKWQTVMAAVFTGTLLNLLIAVIAGSYITRLIPLSYINIAAAVLFIAFGLWTLKSEDETISCEEKKSRFSPFWTVAITFFIGEMGDKTQLTALTMAAKYNSIIPVWLGGTIGMVIADAIGIIAGTVMHKRIPEKTCVQENYRISI